MDKFTPALLGALALSLIGCDSDDTSTAPAADSSALSLRLIHLNDHHSHLDERGLELTLDGADTDVRVGGFARVVSKIAALRAGSEHALALHAGDAITGDLYYTLFKGEADAAMMNQVCFDAMALGNHEFDDGDAGLARFIDALHDGACQTPVLAANVRPEVGVSPLAPDGAQDYIRPSIVRQFGDARVGIVGIDIANKTKQSSSPDPSTAFLDEVGSAQAEIDALKRQGVNKIVVLSHYQYDNELAMARALTDVDVVIGGDSHTLLGDDFDALGLTPSGPYPTMTRNADGDTVCVVQAWEYSQVVGELNVQWGADGSVVSCEGRPHLLLGDRFERDDAELTGAARQRVLDAIAASPVLDVVTPDAGAEAVLAGFSDRVEELQRTTIGSAAQVLCHERIPGQGRSALCEVGATAQRGSDIANLVAQAFRSMSRTSDIAIQNAGGVRVDIDAGPISIGDAYTLLPFANTLVELEMSGAEIVQVLEQAYAYALDPDGSTGAYPYAAGLRWELDGSRAQGERFTAVQVKRKGESGWSDIEAETMYKVVTNDYIAGGKDGYLGFGDISAQGDRVTDTYLDYAQSFVDYVRAQPGGVLNKLAAEDYSTQRYTPAP